MRVFQVRSFLVVCIESVLCRRGYCYYGKRCRFAHGEIGDEIYQPNSSRWNPKYYYNLYTVHYTVYITRKVDYVRKNYLLGYHLFYYAV